MFREQLKFVVIISLTMRILQIKAGDDYEYYDNEYYYDEDELIQFCHDIEFGSFISSPRGENYYIYCGETTNKSYEAKCPDDTPIFKDGICDMENITTVKPSKKTVKPTTSTKTTKYSTSKKTTASTKKTTAIKTTKPTTKPTTSTTMKQLTTPDSVTTIQSDFCPTNDNTNHVIFLQSKKDCVEYFICYHGNPLPMYCAHKLHFNPVTYKCDFPEKVQCKINETVKPFPKCKTITQIEFYEHPDNCNYFLCCIYGNMFVQQCPYLHHWDFLTKSCIPKHMSTCKNNNRIY